MHATAGPKEGVCTYTQAAHASDPETPALWHIRLGHSNYQNLFHLVSHGLVKGITCHPQAFKSVHNHTCEVCIMARHARAAAPPRTERAEQPLETLHSDVCVYPEASLAGESYAVTLLDEYTGYAGVGTLHRKSDVEDFLKAAIVRWETATGKPCKRLFTDRGGEYLSHTFAQWCKDKGITHVMSAPRTPHQNGAAERLNQTLNNTVRAMLLQYALPKTLWAHALLYAVQLHNVSLHKTLGVTPFQAFNKRVPNVQGLRTFGCRVYARMPETTRDKLDPKSEVGIYLGPATDGPGHKVLIYNPGNKRTRTPYKVQIHRDIVTMETSTDLCTCGSAQGQTGAARWGGQIGLPWTQRAQQQPAQQQEPLTGHMLPDTTRVQQLHMNQLLANQSHPIRGAPPNAPLVLPSNNQQTVAPAPTATPTRPAQPSITRLAPVALTTAAKHSCTAEMNTRKAKHPRVHWREDDTEMSQQQSQPSTSGGTLEQPAQYFLPANGQKQIPKSPLDVPLPTTVQEAMKSPHAHHWREALNTEMQSIQQHGTYDLVSRTSLPLGAKILPCRFVFVVKPRPDGTIQKFKARLVVGGHRQTYGVDYTETYAPVSRHATVRTLLAVAAHHNWEVHHIDITTAFLNGPIDADVYMQQPPGYADGTDKVCKLNKSLYGLKQAPRLWYETLLDTAAICI